MKATRQRPLRQRQKNRLWSLPSLGMIVVLLLLALAGLFILMRNATEQHLQDIGIEENRTLDQLSSEMDTIDIDVLDAQTQLLTP